MFNKKQVQRFMSLDLKTDDGKVANFMPSVTIQGGNRRTRRAVLKHAKKCQQ